MAATRPGHALHRVITRFRRAKILVIGDLMLDEFVWGKVSRISPEAPVPVVWVQSESLMPGGAANVANNIRALGGQVTVAGFIGEDRWGELLLRELASRKVRTGGVVRTRHATTVKTRVIAHHQQVVRVDREQREAWPAGTIERLIKRIASQIEGVDAVVIEDYGKGVITRQLLESVIPLARRHQKIITVDPKDEHFDLYHRVTALTPNRAEAGTAINHELESDHDVEQAGKEILRRLECEGVLITLGEDGMWLFGQAGRPPRSALRGHPDGGRSGVWQTRIPTVAQEVFDVAGAGDTVIGTFTLALASGASMEQAARIANHAAGIVVGKLGVGVTTPDELIAALKSKPTMARRQSPGASLRPLRGRRSRLAQPGNGRSSNAASRGGRPFSRRQ